MVYIIALASLWAGLYLAIYAGVTNPLVGIAIAIVFPITILATWGAKPKPAPKPQPTPTKPPEPTIKVGRDDPLTKITCDTLGAALNKVLDENDAKTVAEGKVLTEADRKQLTLDNWAANAPFVFAAIEQVNTQLRPYGCEISILNDQSLYFRRHTEDGVSFSINGFDMHIWSEAEDKPGEFHWQDCAGGDGPGSLDDLADHLAQIAYWETACRPEKLKRP